MKKDIHPKYYTDAKITCACGATWTTGSTKPELRTDICSSCHPFYTGQAQRLVDRGGMVQRFNDRAERAKTLKEQAAEQAAARAERERARALVEIVDEEDAVEPLGVAESAEDEG